MSSYPVGYEADYVPERSRLTTFFRYLLAIPLMILMYVYGIGLLISWLISGLVVLFTAKYPEGLYTFNSNVVRFMTRLNGYTMLLTDQYPPFDLGEHPEYPVRVPVAPPLESYSRLKVFFRYILAIPPALIMYALAIVSGLAALASWFVIVVTGRQPEGLQNAINLGLAYQTRFWAYELFLTEEWPPFSPDSDSPAPAPPPPAAPVVPEAPVAG
jgi:hypothetical protein